MSASNHESRPHVNPAGKPPDQRSVKQPPAADNDGMTTIVANRDLAGINLRNASALAITPRPHTPLPFRSPLDQIILATLAIMASALWLAVLPVEIALRLG
jgi:hypothetical protein